MAYVTVNGERLAPAAARDLAALAAEFRRVWGVDLLVSSGTRTYAEQERIFRERYTLTPNGRHVYDKRVWQGRTWYRISALGTVLPPGTSLHESDRAVDVRDSGLDKGVLTAGTARSNWLRDNAPRFGFKVTGLSFGEPWHMEYQRDPWAIPAAVAPAPAPIPSGPAAPDSEELHPMYIAIVKNSDYYLVNLNKAVLLGRGALGSGTADIPRIAFADDWAVAQLKSVVSGIK